MSIADRPRQLNHVDPTQAMTNQLQSAHQLLNHDFCPWANRWVYWMKQPLSVIGLLLLTCVLCGWYVNQVAFGFAGIVLTLSLLGIVWPWVTMQGVDCHLEFDRTRSRVDQPVKIRIHLRNRWPFPVWGLELKKGFTVDQDDPNGIALACLWGWSQKEIHWHFQPQQRGEFPRHIPSLETGFPFGLIGCHKVVQFNHKLLVWPKINAMKGIPETLNQSVPDDRFSDRQVGDSGDLLGTRDFRMGDSLRRVHWGQTARKGRLIVTERQAAVGTMLRVIPDFTQQAHNVTDDFSTLEIMIETLASIVTLLHNQHQYVECLIEHKWYYAGKSDHEFRQLMDALARLPKMGLTLSRTPSLKLSGSGISQIRLLTSKNESIRHATHVSDLIISADNTEDVWRQFSLQWKRLCHAA